MGVGTSLSLIFFFSLTFDWQDSGSDSSNMDLEAVQALLSFSRAAHHYHHQQVGAGETPQASDCDDWDEADSENDKLKHFESTKV